MTQTRWTIMAPLIAIVVLVAIIYFFGLRPLEQLNQMKDSLEAKDYLQLRGSALGGLAQALGGAILLIGLFFTWRNLRATEANIRATQQSAAKSLAIAQEGQITERFTRAIEQLSNKESLAARLGGIYALERIASDSERDHWPVMEILTAYVRENAKWKEQANQIVQPTPREQDGGIVSAVPALPMKMEHRRPDPIPPLPKDIQAILTVLGRRTISHETGKDRYLDLRDSDLAKADLALAHLEHTMFYGAHLEEAVVRCAHLEDASFLGAHLEASDFSDADLAHSSFSLAYLDGAVFNIARAQEVDFSSAHLNKASFLNTNLEQANFIYSKLKDADFENAYLAKAAFLNANLEGANLKGANLTEANLADANLGGAALEGADLSSAHGLTIEQLASADYRGAILPKPVAIVLEQQYPLPSSARDSAG